jgi:hypothetical protein
VPNKDNVIQIFAPEDLRDIFDEGLQRWLGGQKMGTLAESS